MFIVSKTTSLFLLVSIFLFPHISVVSAQPITKSLINAEEICSSYKKSVGVVMFIDNRVVQTRSTQERIPVILEERNGVITPVLDIPNTSLISERVIRAGDTVPFVGVVKNKTLPVLGEASLVVFVYKVEKDREFLVDRFIPVENISLKTGEFKEFPFSWTVPIDFAQGEYVFRSYVVSANTFIFHGSSFEKEASVGNLRFSVEGKSVAKNPFLIGASSGVEVSSDSIIMPRTGTVPVTIVFQGGDGATRKIPVSISVYSGVGADTGALVHSEERIIDFVQGKPTLLEYFFSHDAESRYFMTIKSRDSDTVSLGYVSVFRQNKGEVFVSFATLDKNATNTTAVLPFAVCLNSFGQKIAESISVTASLVNSKGKILDSQKFGGTELKNALSGYFNAPTDTHDLGFFVEVKNNEKILQRVSVSPTCTDCSQENTTEDTLPVIIITGTLLSLIVAVSVYLKKRSSTQDMSIFKNEK